MINTEQQTRIRIREI